MRGWLITSKTLSAGASNSTENCKSPEEVSRAKPYTAAALSNSTENCKAMSVKIAGLVLGLWYLKLNREL